MKTPRIQSLVRRWKIYKWTLVGCLALNVFSIVSAIAVGFTFFGGQREFGRQQTSLIRMLSDLDRGLDRMSEFQQKWATEKNKKWDEEHLFVFFNEWLALRTQTEHLLSETTKNLWEPITPKTTSLDFLTRVKNQLSTQKADVLQSLERNLEHYESLNRMIIVIGLATLIFGIILPLTVIYLVQRTLNSIRKEIQQSILQMIRTWSETKLNFGDDALKNIEFWLEIALLVGQTAAQMSSHPAAMILAEMAELLRQEIAKNKKKTVAA